MFSEQEELDRTRRKHKDRGRKKGRCAAGGTCYNKVTAECLMWCICGWFAKFVTHAIACLYNCWQRHMMENQKRALHHAAAPCTQGLNESKREVWSEQLQHVGPRAAKRPLEDVLFEVMSHLLSVISTLMPEEWAQGEHLRTQGSAISRCSFSTAIHMYTHTSRLGRVLLVSTPSHDKSPTLNPFASC